MPYGVGIAFSLIKNQFEVDNAKYMEKLAKCRENGAKGGRPRTNEVGEEKSNGYSGNQTDYLETEQNHKEKEKDKVKEKENVFISAQAHTKTKTSFQIPLLKEVQAYCLERNNSIDPERFVDFYTSKGWKIGNTGMKDWRAAIRNWERKDNNKNQDITEGMVFD